MAYPNAPITFAARSNGQTIDASHVGDLQTEVAALEDGLLNGTARLNSSNSTLANLSVLGGSTFAAVNFASTVSFASSATFSTGVTVSTGVLVIGQGQIAFPATQVASADAQTLDQYKELTWTPVIGGSGGTSGQSYSVQTGHYVKIGQFVLATFECTLSAKGTITTNVQIQGLPFAILAGSTIECTLGWHALATNWVYMTAENNAAGGTAVTIRGLQAAGTSSLGTALATADIGNTSIFRGCIIYRANA